MKRFLYLAQYYVKTRRKVPIFYDEVLRFTSKNVTGLGINPINLLDLRRVKKH
jgi:hypothetical protein